MFLTPFIFGEYCVRLHLTFGQMEQQIANGNLPSNPVYSDFVGIYTSCHIDEAKASGW